MKLSHKLVTVSAAALIGISPVLAAGVQNTTSTTVQAATTKADTIVLSHHSYVYSSTGKRITKYKYNGKTYSKLAKGTSLKAYGTKKIDGKVYYFLGNNSYVKAANVGTVNGKKVTTSSAKASAEASTTKRIKLTHNAYVYDKNGKRIKSAGTLKKNATVAYVGTKTIGDKSYYNLGKGQYIKKANAKVVKTSTNDIDTDDDETYITLVSNSIIYNKNGSYTEPAQYGIKGSQYAVLGAKKIGEKWYYQIGENQYIKAVNAYVSQGKTIITDPTYVEPTPTKTTADTIVMMKTDAPTYNSKGEAISNNPFSAGQSLRVSSMLWIWVKSENQAVEFYKIASDSSSYVKVSDVQLVSGRQLTPTNTMQDAKDAVTVATSSDKSQLNSLISNASTVKQSDAYKLSANTLRSTYDSAITAGEKVNNSSTATVAQVKQAVSAITSAQSALNGARVNVTDRNVLTQTEIAAIIKVAAAANDVNESDIQYTNNQTLTINSSNGQSRTLNISDYIN